MFLFHFLNRLRIFANGAFYILCMNNEVLGEKDFLEPGKWRLNTLSEYCETDSSNVLRPEGTFL